jgi:NAD(P)-dependent dehydrogenase (short-subunit alcohol dehydrogenase family)
VITETTSCEANSAEKTKVSERLARLNADREKIATRLTDLETAERVLTRVSTTPSAGRPRSASATEGKTDIAGMALYLASDDSRMVTGQVLPVDSGVTIS